MTAQSCRCASHLLPVQIAPTTASGSPPAHTHACMRAACFAQQKKSAHKTRADRCLVCRRVAQSSWHAPGRGALLGLALSRRLIGRTSIWRRRRHAVQRVACPHEGVVAVLVTRLAAAAALSLLPRRSRRLCRAAHRELLVVLVVLALLLRGWRVRRRVGSTLTVAAREGMPAMPRR